MSAMLFVVGWDGDKVHLFDVTTMDVERAFKKLEPHLTQRERSRLSAAANYGFDRLAQFIQTVTMQNTGRTFLLMQHVTN